MAIKVTKANDVAVNNIKCLIYGKSGTGKTYASTGGGSKTLVIDLEKGTASAKTNVDIITCDTALDFKEALSYAKENQSKYDTIVIDSISRYSEMLFVALSEYYPDKKESRNLWGLFDTTLRQRNEDILSLDANIIIIALEEDVVTETGYIQKYPLLKAKKFKMMLPSFFDLVLYFDVADDMRCYHVEPMEEAITKNRFQQKVDIPSVVKGDNKLFAIDNLFKHIKENIGK